jgi:GAF domain-containing protein
MLREQSIVRTFVELTDTLVEDFDVVELLTVLAARCVEVLDVAAAGLMLVNADEELRVIASSSETMRLLELFELQSEEGPCTECFASGAPVVHPRLTDGDLRWPRFSPRALEAGFHSVHALPMRLRGQTIGALNLFRAETGSLSKADLTTAQAFADVATIAILQNRAASEAQAVNDQLNHALNSRIVIEQAKGMVAERDGLDMDHSFRRLRAYARSHNLRLVDVACSVIDGSLGTGSLDPKATRREA